MEFYRLCRKERGGRDAPTLCTQPRGGRGLTVYRRTYRRAPEKSVPNSGGDNTRGVSGDTPLVRRGKGRSRRLDAPGVVAPESTA